MQLPQNCVDTMLECTYLNSSLDACPACLHKLLYWISQVKNGVVIKDGLIALLDVSLPSDRCRSRSTALFVI